MEPLTNLLSLFLTAVCELTAYISYLYHFVNESKTWTEAQSYCRQHYTDLATVNDMDEMNKLNQMLEEKLDAFVWIGLQSGGADSWGWSDTKFSRRGLRYKNWNSGEPNNNNENKACVWMNGHAKWIDGACTYLYYFMCYDGSISAKSKLFVFISESKTWTEAQSYCREHHTDLASVVSQAKQDAIKKAAKDNTVWIGLFRDFWSWSDQSTSSFRYWQEGQPNTVGGKCTAVRVTKVDNAGHWYNMSCDSKNPFFCHDNKLVLIQQRRTWREALRYCREKHVDLVSVHSEEIQLWVMEVAQNASTEHVWLGLRHTCSLSFWFWVSGQSVCYQNWAPGNGTEDEDCGPVEKTGAVQAGGEQQWVSLPETQTLNFICTKSKVSEQQVNICPTSSETAAESPEINSA
ncbi:macrophage mannose receptor 1-like [Salminus brasiliensis]|uniref:macrophage mannose receptor 1-like n=1 Tax=Salminus brasiliensis TaxID=930266 RepID=UPI003B837696